MRRFAALSGGDSTAGLSEAAVTIAALLFLPVVPQLSMPSRVFLIHAPALEGV
jgi:hypothetical protein